jgi:hypothetical protein
MTLQRFKSPRTPVSEDARRLDRSAVLSDRFAWAYKSTAHAHFKFSTGEPCLKDWLSGTFVVSAYSLAMLRRDQVPLSAFAIRRRWFHRRAETHCFPHRRGPSLFASGTRPGALPDELETRTGSV